MNVADLYVYPVKGLSPQPLHSVDLEQGRGFPFDREFALALRDGDYYPGLPVGLSKTNFLMLMRDESLASAKTRFDPTTGVLTAQHPDGDLVADLNTDAGRERAAAYFGRLAGLPHDQVPLVAHDAGRRFTDLARRGDDEMHSVSIINLATVRDLEERTGARIDPLRFRANIYLDGGEPFDEREIADREFTIGDVLFRWTRETTRCPATEVDPATGARDLPVVSMLGEHHGHAVMGFYARVMTSGTLRTADELAVSPR